MDIQANVGTHRLVDTVRVGIVAAIDLPFGTRGSISGACGCRLPLGTISTIYDVESGSSSQQTKVIIMMEDA